ncbi:MAG: 2Fe-2S iron-sulfur cluster-binding protein [Sphingomonadales bacterium]
MPRITFISADGATVTEVNAAAGATLLEVAQAQGLDIEGACEGAMACSTCHVILEPDAYDRLGPPSEEEADMLDLTAGLTMTSRLGCQVVLTEALDGLTVRLPAESRNMLGL